MQGWHTGWLNGVRVPHLLQTSFGTQAGFGNEVWNNSDILHHT